MNSKILEEKMELLRWVINLNDEQVIKNLINFKNEIFGVPFAEPAVPLKGCFASSGGYPGYPAASGGWPGRGWPGQGNEKETIGDVF